MLDSFRWTTCLLCHVRHLEPSCCKDFPAKPPKFKFESKWCLPWGGKALHVSIEQAPSASLAQAVDCQLVTFGVRFASCLAWALPVEICSVGGSVNRSVIPSFGHWVAWLESWWVGRSIGWFACCGWLGQVVGLRYNMLESCVERDAELPLHSKRGPLHRRGYLRINHQHLRGAQCLSSPDAVPYFMVCCEIGIREMSVLCRK